MVVFSMRRNINDLTVPKNKKSYLSISTLLLEMGV